MSEIPALCRAVVFFAVLMLSGCLGGGGGGGTSAAPGNVSGGEPAAGNSGGENAGDPGADSGVTVPLLTAYANLVNNGYDKNFTISGTYDTTATPITGSGSKKRDPATSETVNGITLLKQLDVTTGSYTHDGNTSPITTSSSLFFDPSTYANVFEEASGSYIEFPLFSWPTSAKAGDAAYFGNATVYRNRTKDMVTGTLQISYAVTADTASSLLFSTRSELYDTSANHVYHAESVYRVTTSGEITPVNAQATYFKVNGSIPYSMTFTFQ